LRELQTLANLVVASTVVAATELTIQWNNITGVGDLNSAGQLIPMLIGVGFVTRVVYIGVFIKEDNDGSDTGSSSSGEEWMAVISLRDDISYVEPPPTLFRRPDDDLVSGEVYHLPHRRQQSPNQTSPGLDTLGTPRPMRLR
jgi:hypothetical protein